MNKKILLLSIFLIAICINITKVEAKAGILLDYELTKNKAVLTSKRTKKTYSVQEYYNSSAITTLSNPCTDCKIAVRVWNSKYDWSSSRITIPGKTYEIGRTTHAIPGEHQLQIARYDFTLLKTEHTAFWYLD